MGWRNGVGNVIFFFFFFWESLSRLGRGDCLGVQELGVDDYSLCCTQGMKRVFLDLHGFNSVLEASHGTWKSRDQRPFVLTEKGCKPTIFFGIGAAF